MKVTTRDLFNFHNPALKYTSFLKHQELYDGELQEEIPEYQEVLEHKRNGTLAGEQVQHDRSNDEVDIG